MISTKNLLKVAGSSRYRYVTQKTGLPPVTTALLEKRAHSSLQKVMPASLSHVAMFIRSTHDAVHPPKAIVRRRDSQIDRDPSLVFIARLTCSERDCPVQALHNKGGTRCLIE